LIQLLNDAMNNSQMMFIDFHSELCDFDKKFDEIFTLAIKKVISKQIHLMIYEICYLILELNIQIDQMQKIFYHL